VGDGLGTDSEFCRANVLQDVLGNVGKATLKVYVTQVIKVQARAMLISKADTWGDVVFEARSIFTFSSPQAKVVKLGIANLLTGLYSDPVVSTTPDMVTITSVNAGINDAEQYTVCNPPARAMVEMRRLVVDTCRFV